MAVKALNKSSNMTEAARLLGVGLRTLTRWKKEFDIRFDGEKYFTV
jgi:transcriptional regulator with PAS, ATPase and Fis domain